MKEKVHPTIFEWLKTFNAGPDSLKEETLLEFKQELFKITGVKNELARKETNKGIRGKE